jgi:tetratricopeptide (TPR) repeat protein
MKTRHALFAVLFCGYFGISLATDFTATDKALRAGNHESAVAALKQVTAETREDIYGVLLRQAEIALGVGNATLAESLFEKAIFQMPTATEAQAGLTSALMAQGRVKEAQAEARRALREAPTMSCSALPSPRWKTALANPMLRWPAWKRAVATYLDEPSRRHGRCLWHRWKSSWSGAECLMQYHDSKTG